MRALTDTNADAELIRGVGLLCAGEVTEAACVLRAVVGRDPGHLPAVRALATALLAGNRPEGARRVISDYVTDHPMCVEGWLLAARLEWKLARYDEAMRVLGRGLELLPRSARLRRQMAVFEGARGGPTCVLPGASEALQGGGDYFDRVARDTKLLEGLLGLPIDDRDTPMLREVESRLARLLEAQPLHADRQLLLARLQLRLGDLSAATRTVQRALRANPDYPQARRLRAMLLARAGDYEQAIRTLQALIASGCDWPDLHVQVAQWQHARGRNDQARQHLYKALRINPHYARAQKLLERCAA